MLVIEKGKQNMRIPYCYLKKLFNYIFAMSVVGCYSRTFFTFTICDVSHLYASKSVPSCSQDDFEAAICM
jgi:hypothetical protein